jgi:hypothetical protein
LGKLALGEFWRILTRFDDFWRLLATFADWRVLATFPKTRTFCNNSQVNDLIVKIFKSKDGQRLCLMDASIKQHLPLRGEP